MSKRNIVVGGIIATTGMLAVIATILESQWSWRSNIDNQAFTTAPQTMVVPSTNNYIATLPIRAFQKWTNPFPCYDDHTGLIFIKVKKCASTTTMNVVDRIAYRQEQSNKDNGSALKDHNKHCSRHSRHAPASMIPYIPHRNTTRSYLFSVVREPTSRFLSHFYYLRVSQHGDVPNLENFKAFTRSSRSLDHSQGYEGMFQVTGGYQLNYLTTSSMDMYPSVKKIKYWNVTDPAVVSHPDKLLMRVSKILKEYDFIGVVEQMDESLVALSFLLNLSLADIMYAKTQKHAGSYELQQGRHRDKALQLGGHKKIQPSGHRHKACFNIHEKNNTEQLNEFLESDEWKAQIAGDELLYATVKKSLDKTIDEVIGRDLFEKRLKEFEGLMEYALVTKGCAGEKYSQCSSTGKVQPIPCDNQHSHLDCQYDCMNRAAFEFLGANHGEDS